MFRTSFLNVVICLFVKYALFISIIAFIDDRFMKIVINNPHSSLSIPLRVISYAVYSLIHIAIFMAVLTVPLYFIFKINKLVLFIPAIVLFFIVENFVYSFMSSPDNRLIFSNVIAGVVVITLFFYSSIIKMVDIERSRWFTKH